MYWPINAQIIRHRAEVRMNRGTLALPRIHVMAWPPVSSEWLPKILIGLPIELLFMSKGGGWR